MKYFATSAKDNIGVEDAFSVLINKALKADTTGKLNLPEHIKITREDKVNGSKSNLVASHYKTKNKKKG